MTRLQRDMTKFVRKYEGRWNSYALDRDTVKCVCALSNLGIITVKRDQMILKSRDKADRFLSQG